MGLRRRLSKKWDELVDGTLTGPGVDVDSVNTENAYNDYQPNAGLSPWANKRLQGQKRIPVPQFVRSDANPILTPSDLSWSVSTDEIHWPSVMDTANLDNPQAELYLYYGPHDSDGIGVAFADDPEGPWNDYESNPIIGSEREAGVYYDRAAGEVRAYTNHPNTELSLHTSPDGLAWTDEGVVLNFQGGHTGYPRPIDADGAGVYITGWQKIGEGSSNMAIKHSPDGETDWTWIHPYLGGETPTGDGDDTGGSAEFFHSLTMAPYFGGFLCAWHHSQPGTGDIRIGFTRDGQRIVDWGVALDGSAGQAWENDRVSEPELKWHNGKLCLFYAGDGDPPTKLGVAVADFSEVRA